jgi:hypothetical protein
MQRALLLLLLLSWLGWFGPAAQADSPEPLDPPVASIPFDDIDETVLRREVATQALTFLHRLQSHWGQGQHSLNSAVADLLRDDQPGRLVYQRNLSDHTVLEGYEFRRDALIRGQYLVLQGPLNGLNEFIGYYQILKQTLTDSFGVPAEDRVVWENDLYQPVPDYWGVAVMIGYLHYHATWETPEGRVMLELTGDRHSRLLLDYTSHRAGADT